MKEEGNIVKKGPPLYFLLQLFGHHNEINFRKVFGFFFHQHVGNTKHRKENFMYKTGQIYGINYMVETLF